MGYSTIKTPITVPNEDGIITILLEPEAIQLDEYVVTASRRRERIEDAPAAISVISKKEIRRESNTARMKFYSFIILKKTASRF